MITLQGLSAYFRSVPTTSGVQDAPKEKKVLVLFPDASSLDMPDTKVVANALTERLRNVDDCVLDMFLGQRNGHSILETHLIDSLMVHQNCLPGSPPFNFRTYKPHVVDRPGMKETWRQTPSFIWLLITHFPGIYAAKPAFPQRSSG